MKWISWLTEQSQVHPPDNNYQINNGFQYVAVQSLKRLIEAILKCKGINSPLGCYPYFNFAKFNIFIQSTLLSGCPMHSNSFLNKQFAVKCCCVIAKIHSIYKQRALFNRNYLSGFLNFFCHGEHNLKSKPQIIYALWLPTIFRLCPRDSQLHQNRQNQLQTERLLLLCRVCPRLVELKSLCVCKYVSVWSE